jgi:hypothetical protein
MVVGRGDEEVNSEWWSEEVNGEWWWGFHVASTLRPNTYNHNSVIGKK